MKRIFCLLIAFILIFAMVTSSAIPVLAKDDYDGEGDNKDDEKDDLAMDKPDDSLSKNPEQADRNTSPVDPDDDTPDTDSASVLSDGDLWIVGLGALVLVGGIAFVIGKRKEKSNRS